MKKLTTGIVVVLLSFIFTSPAGADDDAKAKHAEAAKARRKEHVEFMKGLRDKRWAFEDEQLKSERQNQDEMRNAHRDAERKRDEAIENASDRKAEENARKEYMDAN